MPSGQTTERRVVIKDGEMTDDEMIDVALIRYIRWLRECPGDTQGYAWLKQARRILADRRDAR